MYIGIHLVPRTQLCSLFLNFPHDHLPLLALGFTDREFLLKQLHPFGQLLVPEAETVHLLLLLPEALVPQLKLLLMKTMTNTCCLSTCCTCLLANQHIEQIRRAKKGLRHLTNFIFTMLFYAELIYFF